MEVLHGGNVEVLSLTGIEGLDPVDVYFHDKGPGAGSLTVTCYGTAWTAWWGGMGDKTVREFVASAGDDYLMGCLTRADIFHSRLTKKQQDYLRRVVKAVQAALKPVEA